MKNISKKNWNLGEELVQKFLEKKWYEIIEKNFRIYGGEIDIIAKKDEIFVFVEVKFRKNENFAHPTELWTPQKARPFLRAMYEYMFQKNLEEENCRIDFIGILPQNSGYKIFYKEGIEVENFEY